MGTRKQGKRRVEQRQKRRVRVRFWSEDFEGNGHTKDISSTGLLIETGKLLELDQRVHLEVSLPSGPFFCEGVVTRIKRTPPQLRSVIRQAIGVQFVGPDWIVKSFASDAVDVVVEEDAPEHIPIGVDLSQVDDLKAAYDQDIKHGGLRVRTTEAVQLDEDISVPVDLPDPHGTIDCKGTVVQIFDGGFALRLAEIDAVRTRLHEIMRQG